MRTASRLSPSAKSAVIVPIAMLMAWLMGVGVAAGGRRGAMALGVATIALVLPLAAVVAPRIRRALLAVEVPVVLLLMSNFSLRVRSTQELATNPLDTGGQFRVGFVGLAGLLGIAALLSSTPSGTQANQRLTSLPIRLYIAYAVVVFAGALVSVNLPLTAYRGVELVVALVVLLGARKMVGADATKRIESTLYWSTSVLVAMVWLGVVFFPSRAIVHLANGAIPIQSALQGVYPPISSNGVGTLGAILVIWSLARVSSLPGERLRPWVAYTLAALGLTTVIFAQYRTGYISLAIGTLFLILLRKKWGLAALLIAAVVGVLLWRPSLISTAEPYVLRGQTVTEAQQLSGRVSWWEAALPVWQESPLIGRGLLTASRFEVFAQLGQDKLAGLHSTWMEALVGTGAIGVALLALSFVIALGRAFAEAFRPDGWVAPAALLLILGVRTLTGNTFESFQYEALVFLWLASSLPDVGRPWP